METAVSRIVAATPAYPDHVVTQEEARRSCEQVFGGQERLAALLRVMGTSGVRRRCFAFPPDYYLEGRSFEERNRDFIEAGLALAERAARDCLARAGTSPDAVDHLIVTTTTGLATPSLDALLVGRLGLSGAVRRWPLFGLGCAGGAGALARAADLPGRTLIVSVELCGQVFSPRALRPVDVVSAALFGDGAVAVLVEQGGARGPAVRARRTELFPGTEHLMGWAFTGDGMLILLSPEVTLFVEERLKPAVERFFREADARRDQVSWWMLHPGGRRILEAYARSFGLTRAAMRWTRESLETVGNLASASVLAVLSDVLERGRPSAGDLGFLAAVGPGFGVEMVLLEW